MLGMHQKLQTAATTGNGTAVQLDGLSREHVFYIRATGTVAGGAVQIEEAHDSTYTGTWAVVGAAVTVADATVKVVHLTGCVGALRARISTAITGGATVDVDYFSNSGE
jgi:hypothetical protein